MSKKKDDNGFTKIDEHGIEEAWWLTASQRQREIIFTEMGSGNFSCTLKEIFTYIEYLKKELMFCEDVLQPLIRGIKNPNELAEEIRVWNQTVDKKN